MNFHDAFSVFGAPCFYIEKQAPGVSRILFNDPATVVFWEDGTKTVVKATAGDKYVLYYGFLAALAKKMYGSNAKVQEMIHPWLPQEEPKQMPFDNFLNTHKNLYMDARKYDNSDKHNDLDVKGDTDGDESLDNLLKLLGLITFLENHKENVNA